MKNCDLMELCGGLMGFHGITLIIKYGDSFYGFVTIVSPNFLPFK